MTSRLRRRKNDGEDAGSHAGGVDGNAARSAGDVTADNASENAIDSDGNAARNAEDGRCRDFCWEQRS